MARFALGTFAALLAVGGAAAAPVPKDAGKADSTPDLKAFFDTVGRAAKDEKWPAEADEKKLRDTAQQVFERTLKAAEQKGRNLPVAFDKLTKADVTKEYKAGLLKDGFVVASDVRITSANNSVIFASGDVQITGATNCVIVARNVRVTGVYDSFVVAGEFVRITGVGARKDGDGSVLVAGNWIRTTSMDNTVCHVIRPTGTPNPEEANRGGAAPGNGPFPAIGTTSRKNSVFLNTREEAGARRDGDDCTYLPPKTPIAK